MAFPEEHLNRANIFIGGLDFDTDKNFIDQQDYVDATNIRNGLGSIQGVIENMQGNVEVKTKLLPEGTNVCIGACEDKRCSTIIYFIYNSLGNHTILRYYPKKNSVNVNGEIELIAQGSALNFNQDWLVHSSAFIDNRYLYWTDGYSEKDKLEGNPPRKINVNKGNNTGKLFTYELSAGLVDQNQFINSPIDGNEVVIEVRFRTTDVLVNTFTIPALTLAGFANDPQGFLNYVQGVFASTFINEINSEFCDDCKINIELTEETTYLKFFETVPGSDNNFVFVRTNHYPDVLREEHIDLIKYPPKCEPTAIYFQDSSSVNYVNQTLFQFTVRYWYDDGEKSAWGPISTLALPLNALGQFQPNFNAVEIDFTDSRLNDPDSLAIIKRVELGFREGNVGVFRSIDTLEICEIGINKQFYIFKNDKLYSVVQSDDTPVQGQTQALKLFDSVPLISGALETVADREGNNRLFLGGNLENYNNPECIDIDYEFAQDEDSECFIDIKGTVEVIGLPDQRNDGYFRINETAGTGNEVNFKLALEGFVVYLAGTDYYGISKSFEIESVVSPTGEFEIKNVPKGRYIMRVASQLCRFDNSLGSRLNLNNGREYQKTSAPIIDCAGSLAATGIPYERVIDITGATGGEFDLDTEPGYGTIKVQNYDEVNQADPLAKFVYKEVYVYDFDGQDDPADYAKKRAAINVERQYVNMTFVQPISGSTFIYSAETDHNGYVYHAYNSPNAAGASSALLQVNIDVADVCGVGPTRNLSVGGINAYQSAADISGLDYFLQLDDDNLNDVTALIVQSSLASAAGAIIGLYLTDTEFTEKNKTLVIGNTQDASLSGLSSVLMQYEQNTRQEYSNVDGDYNITVYCPYNSFSRSDNNLFATYIPDVCYDSPPSPVGELLNIADFCTNPYDIDNPYTAAQITISTLLVSQYGRYLKSGGIYRFGIVYEDRANRKSTVAEANTVNVPYFTEDNYYERRTLKWSINHAPPIWATHYRLVITKESYYRRYLQWAAEAVRYVRIPTFESAPIDTTFANGDATHIMIKISAITVGDGEDNPVEWFFVGLNTQGFNAQPYDRVRFILDQSGNLVAQNKILDYSIAGVYRDGDDYFIVIEDIQGGKEIKPNWLLELYTPKKNEEVVFYEFGNCHDILNPGQPNRAHSGPIQNQLVGIAPAQGFLQGGDTYWRKKNFSVPNSVTFTYEVENINLTDIFESEFSDIGRPNIKDDDFSQRYYFNRIRLSGIYIPDSKINGLSAYRAIDFQSLDLKHGSITKMIVADNVMLAICQFKTQPVYVAKDQVLDLSGAGSIGRSDKILNLANELKYDFGTSNPESVVEQDGNIYAWDAYQGLVWRYASNGQFPISQYKADIYFSGIANAYLTLDPTQTKVFGFMEREYGLYGMTFKPNEYFPFGKTIEFAESKNRWNNFTDFVGEYYGMFADKLVSFQNGKLFLHEGQGNVPCNFYGFQYDADLTFVSNDIPRATKVFWNIQLQADNQWIAPNIEILPNYSYPNGMLSELQEQHFSIEEGVWRADFLRDKTDPSPAFDSIINPTEREIKKLLSGRVLRGETIIVTLQLLDSSIPSVLKRVDVEHNLSMDTKR